jgi:hypothetical protein
MKTTPILRTAALVLITMIVPAGASASAAAPPKPTNAKNGHSLLATASTTNDSVDDFSAFGACNSYRHGNGFNASVLLNTRRYPAGAWVTVRYAYKRVGASTWRWMGWYKPSFINNRVPNNDPDVTIFQPIELATLSFPITSGRFIAGAQLAVWNGSSYEYSFTGATSYDNFGRYGVFLGRASTCWLTV